MTAPLNVLVLLDVRITSCTGAGVIKALKLSDIATAVFAAAPSSHVGALYLTEHYAVSPAYDDPAYLDWLAAHCRTNSIDVILPDGGDFAMIARHQTAIFDACGARAIVQPDKVIAIADDKLRTSRWLRDRGLGHPQFAPAHDTDAVGRLIEAVGFPLIAKPYTGKCSAGVMRLDGARQLEDARRLPDTLIQHHVGTDDTEYTASCFVSKEGEALGTFVLRREIWNGVSVCCHVERQPDIVGAATAIAMQLGARGSVNIQFRLHEGFPLCLDINPRFSGTTGIRAHLGFNDVEAMLRHYVLGEDIGAIPVIKDGTAHRMFTEVYP